MTQNITLVTVCEQSKTRPSWCSYAEGPTGGGGFSYYIYAGTHYTLPSFTCQAGSVTITVTDGASDGDVYEVALDGTRIFQTGAVTYPSGGLSTGTWTGTVTEGTHTVDVWDIILSYIGYDSPFGTAGFPVQGDMDPAGLYIYITCPDAPAEGGAIKRRHVKIHA